MDATTVQDVAKQTTDLALGDAVLLSKANMKMCPLRFQGKPLSLKLGQDLGSTTVIFEPSVYNGTGEETRKGIVLRISDDDFSAMVEFEQWCVNALRATNPTVDSLWSASAKKSDKWGSQLKAKINLQPGKWGTTFYNEAKELCDQPEEWRGLPVSLVLQVRGCYIQRQSIGLLIDVTHLQYKDLPEEPPHKCPF